MQATGCRKAASKLIDTGLEAGAVPHAEVNVFLGRTGEHKEVGMLEEGRLGKILD